MERFRRKLSILIIFWLVIFGFLTIHTTGDAAQKDVQDNKQEDSSHPYSRMLQEAYFTLVMSSLRSWDKAKSYINQFQHKLFPADLESEEVANADGATERVKEAAQKTIGKSKEAVEETAKSAAKVVEETVHKTAEKVKRSVSSGHHDSEEL